MGKRRLAMIISGVLILMSLGALVARGLTFGIDFTGGTLVEVGYPQPVELGGVRAGLAQGGFEDASVQHFGTSRDVLIRLAARDDTSTAELSTLMFRVLSDSADGTLDLRRVEFVGPQVGEELTEQGGLAIVFALLGILVYVALRFEYRFALGSVAALIHDVVITIGFFAILQIEFDLSVLAAVLAVIGYSLNDTIVVYDRIRENFRKMRKGTSVEIINTSLNQTLSRTVMTSLTTLIVLVALFFLGGEIIHGFATALIVGVLIGTYSSIYVASSTVLALGISKADLMPARKEGREAEERP
jgi:preprotein translocase subunit SecF